jgi:hypothetical protein
MDESNSREVKSSKFNKSNKSADEDVDDNSPEKPKKKCTKCGKWGYHTAEECKSKDNDDKFSRFEEANLASGGKGKSSARRVQKINFLDYNMSDDEEDSLHYHHNNRIKASEITKDDFAYFTQSHSEEEPSSELGWESRADSSRGGDCLDDD